MTAWENVILPLLCGDLEEDMKERAISGFPSRGKLMRRPKITPTYIRDRPQRVSRISRRPSIIPLGLIPNTCNIDLCTRLRFL